MHDSTTLTMADIDAVWALLIAASPNLIDADTFRTEGFLANAAIHMMQARLALKMRIGAEFVPVSKQWRDMATGLVHASQSVAQSLQSLEQAFPARPPAPHTPAQTTPQALDASAPDAGVQQ